MFDSVAPGGDAQKGESGPGARSTAGGNGARLPGMTARDWARPVVHWEIAARDADRQADFYRQLFNWEVGEGPIRQIAAGLGGPEPGPGGHIRPADRAQVTLYVQVRDLRSSLERARQLGGEVLMEPVDLAEGPTIAAISDPEGNPVGLVQQ